MHSAVEYLHTKGSLTAATCVVVFNLVSACIYSLDLLGKHTFH